MHGDYRLDNLMFDADDGQRSGRSTGRRSRWRCRPATWPTSSAPACRSRTVGRASTISWRRTTRRWSATASSDYAPETCWDDYRFAMVQGPLVAVFGYAYGTRTERGDRMFAAMVQRACAAIRDLDTLALGRR